MADFEEAIDEVLNDEGYTAKSIGYVNDPDDAGGETVAGITLKWWKDWSGWPIINAAKKQPNFPQNLVGNKLLKEKIKEFYKDNFWKKIGGDSINAQVIASQLVNTAVLEGIVPAVKRAQGIVNVPQNGIFSEELATKLNNLA
jgi:lysozyme family protein